jgi:hypothetical protein
MGARRTLMLMLGLAVVIAGCGGSEPDTAGPEAISEAGAQHIHGVGINPADDSVMIATHAGLFRAASGESRAQRVGDQHQDTMGFTIVGPDEFLGSGHPDARTDLPPLLGLIRSNDGGRSWTPVSLLGEADFHVLRAAGPRIYGYDSTTGRLMVSANGGRSWSERRPPAPLFDLAIDPADPDRILASSEAGIAVSQNAGESWRPIDSQRAGLLAWTNDAVTLVDGAGAVHRSTDSGRTWTGIAKVDGRPAALNTHDGQLLLALHTNEVKASSDAGKTWSTRVEP